MKISGPCLVKGCKCENIEGHHVFPKCHYGIRGRKVPLCHTHHRELERMICEQEGADYNGRIKRPRSFYLRVLEDYLTEKIHEYKNMESPSDNGDSQ